MNTGLRIAFFGSSLLSSYWNGAATYYRGIIKALADRGHRVTFYEPDAYDRQKHRDIAEPSWAKVVVYPGDDEQAALDLLDRAARDADVLVKASGIGVYDQLLESAVPAKRRANQLAVFWDVDAPATLERVASDERDPFIDAIPRYDCILTYGGGPPVIRGYRALGAKRCVPIYNALDPDTHFRVGPDPAYAADLALLANRLPDREQRIDEFFFKPARLNGSRRFLLGGSGWDDKPVSQNVHYIGHVSTRDHNAFNSTPLAVLNVARDSMAKFGHSPATRVFEAAGAGSCLISDAWQGIEAFLEPGTEILVAQSGEEVSELLSGLDWERARAIGQRARERVLAEHTYALRAKEVEAVLGGARHVPSEELCA